MSTQLSYNWFAGYSGSGPTTWEAFNANDFTFVSDQPNSWVGLFPSGNAYEGLHLPPDFPRQVLLNRIRITFDGDRSAGAPGEIDVWVDPGGVYFHSGQPPGSQTNVKMSKMIGLRHQYFAGAPFTETTALIVPIAFNRDAGDKLFVEFTSGQVYSWLNVEFGYLSL